MYKVFIDLDGVMVDMHNGLREATGFTFPTEYNDASRKAIHQMWYNLSHTQPNFWYELKPFHYHKQLYSAIREIDDTPIVLSATPEPYTGADDHDCRMQKISWVVKHFGMSQGLRTIITKSKLKQNFILPEYKCILVDDHPGNIQRWTAAGGIGIHHTDINQTLNQLKDYTK